jgi:hypothetical protein
MSINKILTSQYQDLSQEEIANLQHTLGPVIGGGLEGYWRPSVSELGNITWTWSNASTATPPAGANIKGDKGDPGVEGDKGDDGTSIVLQSVTDVAGGKQVTLAWGETPSTSSFIIPSGTPGTNGTNGKDGTSIYLKSVTDAQGGKQVTLGWGTSDTSAFVIPSGAAGTNGTDGVSPTVELTPIQDQQYPQGGWNVTITDAEHQSGQTFQIFNGIDGQGATVDLVEGNGIQITHQAGTTDYTIGVSANYALKSELPDVTDMATKTWVGQQGYLTSIPNTYALKTDVEAASANALGQAQSWVETEGYLKAVPAEYATKTYANEASAYALSQAETYADSASAEALSQAKSWTNLQNFATSAGLADDKQFAMTTSGWKEVQGGGGGGETNIIESIRLEGDSADVTITNKKATIPLATASATGVAGNTGVITKDDKAHLDAAVEYKENPYDSSSPKALVPQQMFVCESDQQIIDIVTNHTDLINGKGTIFFRITGI